MLPDLRTHVFDSALLRDNPWNDPHVRRLPVYVPPGYDPRRAEPYPVAYVLAGWSGRGAKYLADGGVFYEWLPDRFDRMVRAGTMPPTIVVFPDCTTRLGASQYVNSVANGPYMDYLSDELVPFIDAEYHTHASREMRGLVGHSSGGFGALVTAMLRPDAFSAICSSAGDGFYEHLYVACIPAMIGVLEKAGGIAKFVETFLESPNPWGLLSNDHGMTMMCLSICPCFAPNLSAPVIKGDLYFDLETGALVPEVWSKFLDWDPVRMVDRHPGALRRMRWIHLEAGVDDEYGLQLAHRQLAARLREHGIPFVLDEYPGKHGGHDHRTAERIARMSAALLGR
jgi:enterochelin esterase family protein